MNIEKVVHFLNAFLDGYIVLLETTVISYYVIVLDINRKEASLNKLEVDQHTSRAPVTIYKRVDTLKAQVK